MAQSWSGQCRPHLRAAQKPWLSPRGSLPLGQLHVLVFLSVTTPFYQSPRPKISGVSCSKLTTTYAFSFILSASMSYFFCLKTCHWGPWSPPSFSGPPPRSRSRSSSLHLNDSCRSLNASPPSKTTCSLTNPLRNCPFQCPAQTTSVAVPAWEPLPPFQGSHFQNPQLSCYFPTASPVQSSVSLHCLWWYNVAVALTYCPCSSECVFPESR